jgi:hypothetical protein
VSDDPDEVWAGAREIAKEVIAAFSMLHPNIRMNRHEWMDLEEMIEREVRGHYERDSRGELVNLRAYDLLAEANE